jgi:hypothetical protein
MTTAAELASYASSFPSFRNRIINGDMRIDQRNAGGIVTVNSSANFYPVDRYKCTASSSGGGIFTLQRDTNAPAGFTNSLKVVVTTADSTLANTSIYMVTQVIEGFNIADLGWGTNVKPVTLSFWVRSSVASTDESHMGGVIRNLFDGATSSYPFSYTINSANTWEQKVVTIAGPNTGTFGTTNNEGITVGFTFGSSSDRLGTDATWSSNLWGPTGMTHLISTLNATWYITGVQLEEGTVATPFEHRPIGTELALCQRYCQKLRSFELCKMRESDRTSIGTYQFVIEMRATPTIPARTQNPDNLSVTVNNIDTLGFTGSLTRPSDQYGGTVNGGGVADSEL